MNKQLAAVAGIVFGMGIGVAHAQPAKAAPAVDLAALADKLVGTNASIKEGQIVEIVAGPYDTALAEELSVAARKRGAYPFILYSSESLAKKTLASMPAKYDAQTPKLDLALAKIVDVVIVIPQNRDPSIAASIPADRALVLAKTDQQGEQAMRKRNVKFLELSNGLAPSPASAKQLGMTEADLKKLYWDGLNADYAAVEKTCSALQTTLASGKQLQIKHPNGTDLTIDIKGKKSITSDGVISDADIKAGGPAVQAWLPAGDVYFVPGTANGKVVDDRSVMLGTEITGLTLEVKGGKVTGLTAKSGWDRSPVKARWDAASPAKNELSVVDFGCNPAIKGVDTWIPAGNLTIGFGANAWAGGTNKEPFGLFLNLPGTTVLLDGKVIIENGALK